MTFPTHGGVPLGDPVKEYVSSVGLTVPMPAGYTLTTAYVTIPNWSVLLPKNSGLVDVEIYDGLLFTLSTGATNAAGTKFTVEAKVVDELGTAVAYDKKDFVSVLANTNVTTGGKLVLGHEIDNQSIDKTYTVMARCQQIGTGGCTGALVQAAGGFPSPSLRWRYR
jgi:hypothetical protein